MESPRATPGQEMRDLQKVVLTRMAEIGLLVIDGTKKKPIMENYMNKLELNQRTRELLDRVRHQPKFLSVFDMPADLAEAAVWEIGKMALENTPVPLVQQSGYRWYLRELAKLLRTRTEWDLALEMEICMRKWVGYSLDPELLQMLLCECYDRIGAMTPEEVEEGKELTTKTPRHEEGIPKSRSSAIDADSVVCVPASGTNNEGAEPRKHESHEEGSDAATTDRHGCTQIECADEPGTELTTKTPRHEEVLLEPWCPGTLEPATCTTKSPRHREGSESSAGTLASSNEKRCTLNEVTMAGDGNG
jgi:hypothetical protein